MSLRPRILAFIALLGLIAFFQAPLACAQEAPPAKHAEISLIARMKGVGNGGTTFLAVDVKLEPGWHAYWRTPGDAGLAPVFDWTGSTNIEKFKVLWPAPTRFTIAGFDNFGYKERVVFPVMASVPDRAVPARVALRLDLLLCNDICVPETHTLSLDIPFGPPILSPDAKTIAEAFASVPLGIPPPGFVPGKMWLDETGLVLTVRAARNPDGLDVFVENRDQLLLGRPDDIAFDDKTMELRLHLPAASGVTREKLEKSLGMSPALVTFVAGGMRVEKKMTLDLSPPVDSFPKKSGWPGLALLGLALLGGLILNLMPCVLPVLSLKILSALHLNERERTQARLGFAAGAFGIVASFWALAAGLLVLKASGAAIGWGIQFQSPVFLAVLIGVLLLFSVNLAGFFEIPLPRFIARTAGTAGRHPTMAGHFLTGMFATLLATPCSAPFLGTAIGFALAAGPGPIFMIFTAMGLGLALPWIAFALQPGLAAGILPRPGKWMLTLRRFLALCLFATALWLAAVLVSVLSPGKETASAWERFDEARIAMAVAEGRTVLVDVTADWCLTCKANKTFVLDSAAIVDALGRHNVLLMKADWTKKDETIRAYLEKNGRYGIPFNIVYGPGSPTGLALSELLTPGAVLDALDRAAGAKKP